MPVTITFFEDVHMMSCEEIVAEMEPLEKRQKEGQLTEPQRLRQQELGQMLETAFNNEHAEIGHAIRQSKP